MIYRINMKRVINRKLVMGMADGEVEVDGRVIYTATDLKSGYSKIPLVFNCVIFHLTAFLSQFSNSL